MKEMEEQACVLLVTRTSALLVLEARRGVPKAAASCVPWTVPRPYSINYLEELSVMVTLVTPRCRCRSMVNSFLFNDAVITKIKQ